MEYPGCGRHLIDTCQSANLYHYEPYCDDPKHPVLIIFAQVNTPQILDLHPARSFIAKLLQQNLDVYMLEWKAPSASETLRSIDQYILDDIHQAMLAVSAYFGTEKVHLMGICQGGYFCLCYATIFPEKIASLIPIVTPVDFATPKNRLYQLMRFIDIDLLVDTFGNIPGYAVNWILQQTEPFRLLTKKFQAMKTLTHSPQETHEIFWALETWAQNCPAQPANVFREFGKNCVQQNALVNGKFSLKGNKISLSTLSMPILNICAQRDHIWPVETVLALRDYHHSAVYEEHVFRGGHIGIFASESGLNTVPQLIQEWVEAR